MRHERIIFDSDEAAHHFQYDVVNVLLMAAGALQAAHCLEIAMVVKEHAEWANQAYFDHFADRLTPATPPEAAPPAVTLTGTGPVGGASAETAKSETETTGAEAPPRKDGDERAAPAATPVPQETVSSAPVPETALSVPPAKAKRRKSGRSSASPPQAPAPTPEQDIEAEAILFSEGELDPLRKWLAALTCGTREGQRHMQLARKSTGFSGFLPEATEDEVRKLAKEIKLLELRTKKFEASKPPAAGSGAA